MSKMFRDEDMLMLSGIQHFMFCPRQWALIHIDQKWEENRLTTEGLLLHNNVDNPSYRQQNGGIITLRSVSIASKKLGLYGVTDAVELHPVVDSKVGIRHKLYPGIWKPFPIEYKRGKPKRSSIDEVQLAAQAMCMEEMYGIQIDSGALYYGETRHREIIHINEALREITVECAKQMHLVFSTGIIPKADKGKHCKSCSLVDICMPNMVNCQKVSSYLKKCLYEETA